MGLPGLVALTSSYVATLWFGPLLDVKENCVLRLWDSGSVTQWKKPIGDGGADLKRFSLFAQRAHMVGVV